MSVLEGAIEVMQGRSEAKSQTWFQLDAFADYRVRVSEWGDAEQALASILGIDDLSLGTFWQPQLQELNPSAIFAIRNKARLAIDYLPRISALLSRDGVDIHRVGEKDSAEYFRGKTLLSVTLAEEGHDYSRPDRIASLLTGLQQLYSVCAALNALPDDDLLVIALDSGSDKSIDLVGAAKLMAELKALLLGLWDRTVFSRQAQIRADYQVIAEALPIMSSISDLELKEKLSAEHAEILRRQVVDGATKFLKTGAYTAEMEGESSHSPRELMRAERKLLASPIVSPEKREAKAAEPDSFESGLEVEELNPADVRRLRELLARADSAEASKASSSQAKATRRRRKMT